MKRPAKVKVGSKTFAVHFLKADHPELNPPGEKPEDLPYYGLCKFDEQEILIRDGLTFENERSALIHECLEAIIGILKIDIEHDDIERLEEGLMGSLNDNPSLWRFLISKKRSNG